jgi:hypothetical protein
VSSRAGGLVQRCLQSLKAVARGFRNFDNYRARILFHCGQLDLAPVNVRSH